MSNGKKSRNYFVKGMHCASCEILIEKDINKLDGVETVKASLKEGVVEIISTDGSEHLKVEELNKIFENSGYSFSEEKLKHSALNANDIGIIAGVFFLFVVTFLLVEKSGVFAAVSVGPSSSLYSYFIFGIAAGLSSCAALVGGILLTLSKKWNDVYKGNSKKSAIPFIMFNSARLASFAILGGILGILGSFIKINIFTTSLISLAAAIFMVLIGMQMLGIKWAKRVQIKTPKLFAKYVSDETNFEGKYIPFVIGALTFFVPCGFTLIAQTNAVAAGSLIRSSLIMLAFALGTLPVLALVSFSSIKFYNNPKFSAKYSLFAGLLITFFGLYTLNSQLNVLGLPSANDISSYLSADVETTRADIVGDTQVVQMYSEGFEYFPKEISLKSGVPTRIEFDNKGAVGCAQALYAPGLYPKVVNLKDGLNIIEFTPNKPGKYKISCSMGMVPPVTVNVY